MKALMTQPMLFDSLRVEEMGEPSPDAGDRARQGPRGRPLWHPSRDSTRCRVTSGGAFTRQEGDITNVILFAGVEDILR